MSARRLARSLSFPSRRSTVFTYRIHVRKQCDRRFHESSQSRSNAHSPRPELPPNASLLRRLSHAWRTTPTKWYPLPLSVGVALLLLLQFRKHYLNSSDLQSDSAEVFSSPNGDIIRLKGPLHIHVIGALPLRSMSRLWGYLNSLELPMWFRPLGFRLYAFIFGCNLEEIDPSDLTAYKSLGEFFYRRLAPGTRTIEDAILVSPADGKVLHLGKIDDLRRVEQVKGVTYSLDALLGSPYSPSPPSPDADVALSSGLSSQISTVSQVALRDGNGTTRMTGLQPENSLFFAVIYLAPGDYHRFHSPSTWVVERRRHFIGELFSVSPYMAKRLQNLFVLNERVALLGRWQYGFFGMVPVGATNVGSIKVNFDAALRTNERRRPPQPGAYVESSYEGASPLLRGQALKPGEEMGGFSLGSTIVLVFEAPKCFQFGVKEGERVNVGQMMGDVPREVRKSE